MARAEGDYDDVGPGEDARLVAQAMAGDQAGLNGLMQRHRDAVFRLARHHLGGDDEALDVTQESFIAAFASLGRYDTSRPFRAWILRIAINKCRDWARRRAVRRVFAFALPIENAFDIADSDPTPEAALLKSEALGRLRGAIANLPNGLKEPLVLCAIEGLSQGEAARALGISRKAIETRLHRARQKLAGNLTE